MMDEGSPWARGVTPHAMGSWHVNRSGGGDAFKESLGVKVTVLPK